LELALVSGFRRVVVVFQSASRREEGHNHEGTACSIAPPFEIQRVVAEALELLKVSLPPNVSLEQALSASNARVIGDPMQLHRVIFFKPAFSCRNDRCEVKL
jgi:hypothetical protein